MEEEHFFMRHFFHIVFDILRIGGDNRTVIVIVGALIFDALVRNTRIENGLNAMIDQPFDMSVGQLGRIALGLAWNRFDTQLIDLSGGKRRQDDRKTEFCQERVPERIVFIHIQYARNTDHSA